ncbi:MAG: hypothetical protein F6K24_03220 [Okeania sp. SIO2D1]|nr:hypothetical protein [Okeania sp. SIO2D1]
MNHLNQEVAITKFFTPTGMIHLHFVKLKKSLPIFPLRSPKNHDTILLFGATRPCT